MNWLAKVIGEIHADIPESAWEEAAYRQWLHDAYRALDFLMRNGSWSAVNSFLAEFPDMLPPGYAIAALRFLSSAPRDRLPAWQLLLDKMNARLGDGADRMLRGLK